MEFSYIPMTIGNSGVETMVSEESGSFEATSRDLPTIKEALRRALPDTRPTLRLEYAARAFGYRTAASLQAALAAATEDAPLVMIPLVGPLDDDRVNLLMKACKPPTAAGRDAALAVARAIIARRRETELPWAAASINHRRHVVHRLEGVHGHTFLPEFAPPDLRTIFRETIHKEFYGSWSPFWADIPDMWSISLLTPENTADRDLDALRVGVVPPAQAPDVLPFTSVRSSPRTRCGPRPFSGTRQRRRSDSSPSPFRSPRSITPRPTG